MYIVSYTCTSYIPHGWNLTDDSKCWGIITLNIHENEND